MLFAPDTEMTLASAAALVNSAGAGMDGVEGLPDTAALTAFLDEWRYTGDRRGDGDELDAVRALRPRLRRLWELDEQGAVDLVNALLVETGALPQLVRHDHWDWHLHATPSAAPLADRISVEVAMALTDVIRHDELGRLRSCAAEHCERVLVDLSKNRSRRFCSTACANRTNVAAYRSRRERDMTSS